MVRARPDRLQFPAGTLAGLTVLLPHRRSLFHALLAILTVLLLVITVRTLRSE